MLNTIVCFGSLIYVLWIIFLRCKRVIEWRPSNVGAGRFAYSFFFHVKYGYTRRVDYDPHVKSTKRFLSTNITIWINSFGQSNFEEQLSAKYGMFEFQKKIN